MKSVQICNEVINVVFKQIKVHKWAIILSPIVALVFIVRALEDPYIKHLTFMISFSVILDFYLFILIPIVQGNLLRKTFYAIEILNENQIKFSAFGTLWRTEKVVIATLDEIKIDEIPQPKLMYKKYLLNNIYINGKKYSIFNTILLESGLLNYYSQAMSIK